MLNSRESVPREPPVAISNGRSTSLSAPDRLWELTQLERGAFRVKATILALNDLYLGKTSISHTSLHRIKAPAGAVCVVMSGGPFTTMFVGGYRVMPQDCVVLSSSAEVEAVTHRQSDAIALTISENVWGDDAARLQSRGLALRPGVYLLACNARSIAALQNRIHFALQGCNRMADPNANPSLRHALTESLIDQLNRIARDPPYLCAQRRERTRRHTGVELARHYIREHLTDPIRLADLCSHTHLRARSLEYGFHEILCLSPMCYVKMLRLNEVHRQLLSITRARRSISELALDAGFRHLSQFAVDYKRLFLESPSATRRRVASARFAEMANGTQSSDHIARRITAQVDSCRTHERKLSTGLAYATSE
jgi:AraC-like DNA-binding protein